MSSPQSSIWKDAPPLAIPEVPALFCDSEDLWLCYRAAFKDTKSYAIVRFDDVFDHRLSPINDEGIKQHPCFKAGLAFYEFNEITGSAEALRWSSLGGRHWVVTFKENTLDVVAVAAEVVVADLQASSPTAALLGYLVEQVDS